MDYEATIYGSLTLQETQDRCEAEQAGGYALDSITTGSVPDGAGTRRVNKAAFDNANGTPVLTNLNFVSLGGDDPDTVKAKMKNGGWTFICDSSIYVSDISIRVLMFGKT